MDNILLPLPPRSVAAGDEHALNDLRRRWPSIYGQPSECCGEPESCAAACGDRTEDAARGG